MAQAWSWMQKRRNNRTKTKWFSLVDVRWPAAKVSFAETATLRMN
jgi:hypothetical protein